MEPQSIESPIGSDERIFRQYMQQADDFYKIELLRQAMIWYKKALDFNIDNKKVKSLINECEQLLAFENKVVYILTSIVTALLLIYLIVFK